MDEDAGLLRLVNDGGRFEFPADEAAHIAAALAEYCNDPDDCEFVSDQWGGQQMLLEEEEGPDDAD